MGHLWVVRHILEADWSHVYSIVVAAWSKKNWHWGLNHLTYSHVLHPCYCPDMVDVRHHILENILAVMTLRPEHEARL